MLKDLDFVVVDVEATGAKTPPNRLIEFGAYRIRGGRIVDKFLQLVNPEIPIPRFVVTLTGISNDMVSEHRFLQKLHLNGSTSLATQCWLLTTLHLIPASLTTRFPEFIPAIGCLILTCVPLGYPAAFCPIFVTIDLIRLPTISQSRSSVDIEPEATHLQLRKSFCCCYEARRRTRGERPSDSTNISVSRNQTNRTNPSGSSSL